MKRVSVSLLFVLVLSLFGHVLQRACEAADIPVLTITVLRDLLLVALFFWTVKSVPLTEAKWLNSVLLLFAVLFTAYIFISAFEDRFILGVYYLRLYLLPILFFVAAKIALESLDHAGVHALLRGLTALNVLMLITAFALYLTILFFPEHRYVIFGANFVPHSWFAAGEGGSQMRMGLPMTSPNNLGVYFALMLFLFLVLAIVNHVRQPNRVIYSTIVALNIVALVATFSRSSMILALVAVVALFILVPALRSGKMFIQSLLLGLALLVTMICGLVAVELISDGFVTRWMTINVKVQDPSFIGHIQSFVDAYQNFDQYYLYGYPRGTVGPRAFLFYVSDRFNVENSVLIAVYDLGLIGAAWYFYTYYLMLAAGYHSRLQLAVGAGFLVCIQFLPYVFSAEIISLFVFVYLLTGQLDRLGYFAALGCAPNVGASNPASDATDPRAVAWIPSR